MSRALTLPSFTAEPPRCSHSQVRLRSSTGERRPSQSAASGPSQPQSLMGQLAGAMARRRSSIAAAEEKDKDDDDDDDW